MTLEHDFSPADDGLHDPSDSFYDNETFWYSFFVPERKLGGWLYTGIRQHPGLTTGGCWIWDDTATNPWEIPFYENFSYLKQPTTRGPEHVAFPTGMGVTVREPLMSYDVNYDDRDRLQIALQFDAVEPPVPLQAGQPPFPKAHHLDQTGRVTGTVTLDGERIDVDCYAMRDRSWGARTERGYRRIGYTWFAGSDVSLLSYTAPTADEDEIYAGYFRRGDSVQRLVSGTRKVQRDPDGGWLTGIFMTATTEEGETIAAEGVALSRFVLPAALSICINTAMTWTVDGQTVVGEDQDVWPIREWRATQTELRGKEAR